MPQVDLAAYSKFVAAVTSEASRDLTTFMNRLDVLDGNYDFANNQHGPDVNVPLWLITAYKSYVGLSVYFVQTKFSNDRF